MVRKNTIMINVVVVMFFLGSNIYSKTNYDTLIPDNKADSLFNILISDTYDPAKDLHYNNKRLITYTPLNWDELIDDRLVANDCVSFDVAVWLSSEMIDILHRKVKRSTTEKELIQLQHVFYRSYNRTFTDVFKALTVARDLLKDFPSMNVVYKRAINYGLNPWYFDYSNVCRVKAWPYFDYSYGFDYVRDILFEFNYKKGMDLFLDKNQDLEFIEKMIQLLVMSESQESFFELIDIMESKMGNHAPAVYTKIPFSRKDSIKPVYFTPYSFTDHDFTSSLYPISRFDKKNELQAIYFASIDSILRIPDETMIFIADSIFFILDSIGSEFFNSQLNYHALYKVKDSYRWDKIPYPQITYSLGRTWEQCGSGVELLYNQIQIKDSNKEVMLYAAFPDSTTPKGYLVPQVIDTVVFDSLSLSKEEYPLFKKSIIRYKVEPSLNEMNELILRDKMYNQYESNSQTLHVIYADGDTALVASESPGGVNGGASSNIHNIRFTDINGDGLWDIIIDGQCKSTKLYIQKQNRTFESYILDEHDGECGGSC